jgi:acetyl esterase/lipase
MHQLKPSLDKTYQVQTTKGMVYGTGDILVNGAIMPKNLLLDIYEPADAPPGRRAVILWFFGGGFTTGSRNEEKFVVIADELVARGYVVIAIDYRTTLMDPIVSARAQRFYQVIAPYDNNFALDTIENAVGVRVPEEQFERGVAAAFDDGLTALTWLISEAEPHSWDTSRLVLMGSSSGATTANYIAYTADDLGIDRPSIAAVINLWGGLEYTRGRGGLATIEANEAALFLVHSKEDKFVSYANSEQMAAQAAAIGLPYEFHALEGSGHGLSQVSLLTVQSDNGQTLFERMLTFLDRNLHKDAAH